eukprot:TRINITY_DN9843_c0_g2_i1.p1 TRINITY_DN9843_c0_g2~~TRINITY_DN9843_c0_g2_i1.p1  ORF type:complete len:403 (+),score=139.03 TRINITY_DN9843_c0_g2_i1:121-1329(+)
MVVHAALAKGVTQLSGGLLANSHCAVPTSPLFIIAARQLASWSASSTIPSLPLNLTTAADSKSAMGSSAKVGSWSLQQGGITGAFSSPTNFHAFDAFDNMSLGTRVYATSAKPPLQQGSAVTSPPTGAAYKHEGQPMDKSEAQVDKELAEGKYDYWGIRRKQLYKEDGTPWVWHSFTPADSYQADTSVDLEKHWPVSGAADWVALKTVKFLRFWADLLFQKRWGCRAVMLETVAAVPGMVAGMLLHCKSLRRMEHSGGWIKALLEEAENERMHLMTFVEITKPRLWERALVFGVQGVFFNAYFLAYILWPKVCHRIVGYLEEEAVISYTHYLNDIDSGKIANTAAPAIAIDYWRLPKDAKLRDVVLAVRADEAHHRDVNHFAANIKTEGKQLKESPAPIGYH